MRVYAAIRAFLPREAAPDRVCQGGLNQGRNVMQGRWEEHPRVAGEDILASALFHAPQKFEAIKVQVVNVPEADKPKTLTEAEKLRQRKDRWVGSQWQLGRRMSGAVPAVLCAEAASVMRFGYHGWGGGARAQAHIYAHWHPAQAAPLQPGATRVPCV